MVIPAESGHQSSCKVDHPLQSATNSQSTSTVYLWLGPGWQPVTSVCSVSVPSAVHDPDPRRGGLSVGRVHRAGAGGGWRAVRQSDGAQTARRDHRQTRISTRCCRPSAACTRRKSRTELVVCDGSLRLFMPLFLTTPLYLVSKLNDLRFTECTLRHNAFRYVFDGYRAVERRRSPNGDCRSPVPSHVLWITRGHANQDRCYRHTCAGERAARAERHPTKYATVILARQL